MLIALTFNFSTLHGDKELKKSFVRSIVDALRIEITLLFGIC